MLLKIIDPKKLSAELDIVQQKVISLHRQYYLESPSPMKLQKLCYYVQGYKLAIDKGKALFSEDFEAWTYGPVIPALYHKYKEFGYKGIEIEVEEKKMTKNILELIEKIVEIYGRYDGAALSTMTHRETPWLEANNEVSQNKIISKKSMERYFRELLN